MRSWPPPLRVAVPTLFLTSVIVLGLLNLGYEIREERQQARRVVEKRAQILAVLAAGKIEAGLRNQDPGELRRPVTDLAADRLLVAAALVSPDGLVLHSTRAVFEGRALEDTPLAGWIGPELSRGTTRPCAEGACIVTVESVAFPADASLLGRPVPGALILVKDLGPGLAAARRGAISDAAAEMLLGVVAAMLIWLYFHVNVTRRARALMTATETVADADGPVDPGLHGRDVLARLSSSVHRMSTRIHEAREQLAENARNYELLFTGTPLAAWVEDRDSGKILDVNRAAAELYGRSVRSMCGVASQELEAPERLLPGAASGLDPGVVLRRHLRADGEEIVVEQRTGEVEYRGRPARLVVTTDVTERHRYEDALRSRDAILAAVAATSQLLLEAGSVEGAVTPALASLGVATDCDRVYVFENGGEGAGLTASLRWEWTRAAELAADADQLQDVPYAEAGFDRWRERLGRGQPVHGLVNDLPAQERPMLEAQGVLSLLVVPVFAGGDWWGFLGFDHCQHRRAWHETEIDALNTAASLIGAAIAHQRDHERLVRNERRLRDAQRLGRIGHWEFDFENDQVRVSEAAREILGLTSDEPLQRPDFMALVHPADLSTYDAARLALLEDDVPFDCVFRIVTPAAAERTVRQVSEVVRDESGAPIRGFGTIQDLTEQVRREEVLAALHRQLETVARKLPGMIVQRVAHPDGRIEFPLVVGTLVERFRGTVDGHSAPDLGLDRIHPDDRQRVLDAFHGRTVAGGPITVEFRVRDDDGEQVWLRSASDVRTLPDGRVVSDGIVLDVTHEKQTEDVLRRSQKMEALGQLTGGIAHDFNNLLTIIMGNLGFLEEHLPDDADARELLQTIERAGQRGAQLTRRLLDFAQQRPVQPRTLDVKQQIEGLDNLLRAVLGSGIERRYLLEDVWDVRVDPADLENALLNLSINARDAMDGSGVLTIATGNVSLESDYVAHMLQVDPGDYAVITVSDTGTGMSAEVRERIFEPFFTTKEKGKGTGLGLSMVFGFVRRASGDIEVRSETGRGTTFRIFLPRADVTGDVDGVEAGETTPAGSGERVLVVDDEKDLARLAATMLRELGYRAEIETDADGALRRLAGERFDLLFTDVVMPGEATGIDLARRAIDVQPDLGVLLTSGFVLATELERAPDAWRLSLLTKPYSRRSLAQRVREVLDGTRVVS